MKNNSIKTYKKKKLNIKNLIILVFACIFLGIIIFSIFKIITWKKDNENIEKIISYFEDAAEINEDTSGEEINTENNKASVYYNYLNTNLIDVDLSKLKEFNNDTIGWIEVGGTTINYPFVQTSDNEYYLERSFEKKPNKAGWIFMDYRNNADVSSQNTILYAHGRANGIMFGSLNKIFTNNYFNDPKNFYIKLSTDESNTLWEVFSVYHLPTTTDYLQINFSNESFNTFLETIINRSYFDFKTDVLPTDKIITLSTCYSDIEKTVMHAKLIKINEK